MLSCLGLCEEETTLRRAVFLDRDGTINENRADHVKSLDEFILLPGVLAALQRLSSSDLSVIIISNQSVINRGLAPALAVGQINEHLVKLVRAAGGRIDGVYICPHRPDERCSCRKPRPGLLEQAQRDHKLQISGSYVVGDAATDVELAQAANCRPALVLTGRGASQLQQMSARQRQGVYIAHDLQQAVDWILEQEQRRERGDTAS